MEPRDDLVASILRATSGRPCGAAEERLPDLVDNALDPLDAELVRGHLEGCTACTALARVLAETRSALPELAEVDPGRAFTERVLERTSRAPRSRWAAMFEGLWLRPRFALEGAYLGSLVLAGILALPGVPARASHAVVKTAGTLDVRASSVISGAESAAERAASKVASEVAVRAAELRNGTERRVDAFLLKIGWKEAKEKKKETP